MIERQDTLFTVVRDRDLHDNGFKCVQYIGNDHLDLTIPLNRHDHRTIHLGAQQCIQWGRRIERFGHDIISADPARAGDYQI